MRIGFGILATAAVSATGFLVFAAPAMASAAAPDCESGGSQVQCFGSDGAGPYTWTVIEHFGGTSETYSYSTTSGINRFSCRGGQSFQIYYSNVVRGVTQTSPASDVVCNTGPWQ